MNKMNGMPVQIGKGDQKATHKNTHYAICTKPMNKRGNRFFQFEQRTTEHYLDNRLPLTKQVVPLVVHELNVYGKYQPQLQRHFPSLSVQPFPLPEILPEI